MKKLLSLSLAALLCFGCSKDTALSGADVPNMAETNGFGPATRSYNTVWFNYMVDKWDFVNESYVEYTDEYGNVQSVPWATTIEANVQPGSSAVLHIDIREINGNNDKKIYCAVRRAHEGGYTILENYTGTGHLSGTLTVELGFPNDFIELWASLEDFSGGELGR